MKRICSARGRSVVDLPAKFDDTRDEEDSDIEYEEDYEDESDDSLSETEGKEEDRQSRAVSSADDDQPSSPVITGQKHSSQSLECADEEYQSALEENETNSPQEEAPSPVGCSSSNMAACMSAAGGAVKRKIPLYWRKSVFPLFSPIVDLPNTCSLQQLSREIPVHTADPLTESTNSEEKQTTLNEMQKVLASSNAPSDDDPDVQPKTSSKKDEVNLYYNMICRLEYTPLKPIADNLILLHTDLLPTEVCPTLNRSPSFIGVHNQDDGLLSGRSSPKLDIPHYRYHGHKICQHPLAKYTLKMKKQDPTISKSSSEDGKRIVAVQDVIKQAQTTEHQQVREQVESISSVSGEEEKYSSNEVSNGRESQDSKDNVKTEHRQAREPMISGEGEVSCSGSNSSNEETSVENDNVEVYTLEQLAAKFGEKDGEHSSKKQRKHKAVSKHNPYEQWYAKKLVQEKASLQSLPILRSSSYMVAYRKKVYLEKVHKCYSAPQKPPVRNKNGCTQFSKKLTLPPIGECQQQTVHLVPTPPTEAPPTSGLLSAVRSMRRKQYQKKSLQEAVKLVPAHFSYMLDSPQRCIDYVENVSLFM